MTAKPWFVRAAVAGVLLVSIPTATFIGVNLVDGGSTEELPSDVAQAEPTPDFTPSPPESPYPAPNSFPSPGAPRPTPQQPESVEISGVVIPIPQGSHYFYGSGPEMRRHYAIWMGDSSSYQTESGPVDVGIKFDEFGLLYANIAPTEEAAFAATLDSLWTLTQMVATPSPPSLTTKGQSIPMPQGSYYTTEEGPADLGSPLTYVVRLNHSVFAFDGNGRFGVSVRPEDSAALTTTFAALDSLSKAD